MKKIYLGLMSLVVFILLVGIAAETCAETEIDAEAMVYLEELAGEYTFTHWKMTGPKGNELLSDSFLMRMVFEDPWTGDIIVDASGIIDLSVEVPEINEQFVDMFAGFSFDDLPTTISGRIIEMDETTITIESDSCETEIDSVEYILTGDQLALTVPYDFCLAEPAPESEGSIMVLYYER